MRESKTQQPDTGAGSNQPRSGAGDTQPVQGERQQGVPRMPHERDESADSQPGGEPSGREKGRAAQADVERGVQDTTKGGELDDTYDRLRADMPDGEKKFRP
ncbi:MAG: hypothetical protein ACXWC6_13425 [Ramlibacter sp.]